MNKLEVRKFDKSILDHATLITRGNGYFKTYDLNDGNIIKVLKETSEWPDKNSIKNLKSFANYFINELYKKLLVSTSIENEKIILPNSIYESGDSIKAYTVPKLDGYISTTAYLNASWSLESVLLIILVISDIVKKANAEGIVIPDLGSTGNILINPKTGDIVLPDYDGMQIHGIKSFCISDLICNDIRNFSSFYPFFDYTSELYTPSIDKLSLYSIFLYYTTGLKLADFKEEDFVSENGIILPRIKETAIHAFMRDIGIGDSQFEEELQKLFLTGICNFPDEPVKDIVKRFKVDFSGSNGKFISR